MAALRARRAGGDSSQTAWHTANGGLFIEPIERPDSDDKEITLTISLSKSHYKLLEALYDDVPAYISRLTDSHVCGLIKSADYNAKTKENVNK
jgi:hypothetical protein